MGEMRDSDWSRRNLLRSDWLLPYRSHVYYCGFKGEAGVKGETGVAGRPGPRGAKGEAGPSAKAFQQKN